MESNYSYVDENLKLIRENVGEAAEKCGRKAEDIRIMAVTKTVAPEIVNHAIELGLDLLGENRVQEYLSKAEAYSPAEIQFHRRTSDKQGKVHYRVGEHDTVRGQP